jgi:hypothetical protein
LLSCAPFPFSRFVPSLRIIIGCCPPAIIMFASFYSIKSKNSM